MKNFIIKQPCLKAFCVLAFLLVTLKTFDVSANFTPKIQEAKVKAAMIYQIIRMISWPVKKTSLSVCIIGEESHLGNELLKMNRKVSKGRHLSVVRRGGNDPIERLCDVILIQEKSLNYISTILRKIEGRDILSISDNNSIIEQGGLLALYRKDDKIKILINEDAVNKTNLYIDYKLKKLAN